MSTGDLPGNLQRLLRELKAIKCSAAIDEVGLRLGDPVALLPLLNFILLKFSRHVARFIVRHGFELAGKTDQRFVESCFKLFRDVLSLRTVLTPAQFFEQGYAERKVLLLCDVIAVCKRLHNEEVRHERLAALKATRQEPVTSRLVAPRRSSPQIKVVRNDDVEIHQVLAPQHMPNASDGAQSIYKSRSIVTTSRSLAQSPDTQSAAAGARVPPAAEAPVRLQNSSSAPASSSLGQTSSLELTFRPHAAAAHEGRGAQRQPAVAPAAAPQPPIHTWFMNPAFADDANADLDAGIGLGATTGGRPDSSAWWRQAPSPEESSFWKEGGVYSVGAGAARAAAAADSGGIDSSRHLLFGQQPAAVSATATAAGNTARYAAPQQRAPQPQQQTATTTSAVTTAAAVQSRGGPSFPAAPPAGKKDAFSTSRDIDEWSFSKFFGPGKVGARHRPGSSDTDDMTSSSQGGDSDYGDPAVAIHTGHAAAEDDLERDGPSSDQDHRSVRAWSPGSRPATLSHGLGGGTRTGTSSPNRQQQPQLVAGTVGRAMGGSAAASSGEFDLAAKLGKLERDSQEQMKQIQQMQSRLATAEVELERARAEGRQVREALQARVTVLEGRVRFLECELELCVKRGPGQSPPQAGSPEGRNSPDAWRHAEPPLPRDSLPRTHPCGSTGSAPQLHPPEVPPAAPAPQPRAVAANPQDPGPVSAPAATALPTGAVGDASRGHLNRGVMGIGSVASTTSQLRDATATVTGGGVTGSRVASYTPSWTVSSSASGNASYSTNTSRDGTRWLPGQAAPAAAATMPQTHQPHPPGVAPALSQQSLHRGPPTFPHMPQPTFSFQPGNLMMKVAAAGAAAAAAASPSSSQQARLYQPEAPASDDAGASVVVNGLAGPTRSFSASQDSGPASARHEAGHGAGGPGQGAVHAGHGSTGYSHTSSGTGHGFQVMNDRDNGVTAAVPGNGFDGGGMRGGPERVGLRGGGLGSILDRPAAVQDGFPYSRTAPGQQQHLQQQQQQARDSAAMSRHNPHGTSVGSSMSQTNRYTVAVPHIEPPASLPYSQGPAQQTGGAASWGGVKTAAEGQLPAARRVGLESGDRAVGGPGQAAPADPLRAAGNGIRDTDELINSLYLRYTQADDFLQTFRGH